MASVRPYSAANTWSTALAANAACGQPAASEGVDRRYVPPAMTVPAARVLVRNLLRLLFTTGVVRLDDQEQQAAQS